MSSPFVAEIRIWGCNFAPTGWAQCNGQLLPLSQNTALFSLLGTFYGGDGRSTFALPNFQGNAPMFWGQGAGLSERNLGESSGSQNVTLLESEMPAHTHTMRAAADAGENDDPAANRLLGISVGANLYAPPANLQPMAFQSLAVAGASSPHNNMQPFLTLNFCIALQGVFPPRQ